MNFRLDREFVNRVSTRKYEGVTLLEIEGKEDWRLLSTW